MSTGRRAPLAIALLGALGVLLLVAGCHRRELGGTLAKIQKRGQITWGADLQGGEPYLWLDDSGRLVGFEVDVMDAVARRLGVKAKMTHYNWVNLVPLLKRGDFDVVCNGLGGMSGAGQMGATRCDRCTSSASPARSRRKAWTSRSTRWRGCRRSCIGASST